MPTLKKEPWQKEKRIAKWMGGRFVAPKLRFDRHPEKGIGNYPTDFIHPLWYIQCYDNEEVHNWLRSRIQRTRRHKYNYDNRIAILIVSHGIRQPNATEVVMSLDDFRDLYVGHLGRESLVERENDRNEDADDPFEFLW